MHPAVARQTDQTHDDTTITGTALGRTKMEGISAVMFRGLSPLYPFKIERNSHPAVSSRGRSSGRQGAGVSKKGFSYSDAFPGTAAFAAKATVGYGSSVFLVHSLSLFLFLARLLATCSNKRSCQNLSYLRPA